MPVLSFFQLIHVDLVLLYVCLLFLSYDIVCISVQIFSFPFLDFLLVCQPFKKKKKKTFFFKWLILLSCMTMFNDLMWEVVKPTHVYKGHHFLVPTENFIWIERILRGQLSCKATFPLYRFGCSCSLYWYIVDHHYDLRFIIYTFKKKIYSQ